MTRQKGTLLLAAVLVAGMSATSERSATAAARRWRKTRGGARRPACRTAFRTGTAHGGAADVGAPHVGPADGRATDGAANGAAPHAAKYTGKYAATYGDPARECTADGNAKHSAAANGQPDRPAAAIPSGARIAPAAATVGASTVRKHVQMYRRRRNSCRQIRRPIHVTSCGRHVTSCVPSAHCVEPRRANCVGFQRRNARQSASRSIKRVNSVPSPDSSSRSPTQHRRTRTRATGVRTAAMEWRA